MSATCIHSQLAAYADETDDDDLDADTCADCGQAMADCECCPCGEPGCTEHCEHGTLAALCPVCPYL